LIQAKSWGKDRVGYEIAAHFMRQPTENICVRSPINCSLQFVVNMKDTPPEKTASWMSGPCLLSYKTIVSRMGLEMSCPPEILSIPTAILMGSETASAAGDFLMAFNRDMEKLPVSGRHRR
jgi:hypothetical protein